MLGQFAAGVVEQGLKTGALLLQTPLQGTLGQVQGLGHHFALGFALGQQAAQHLASPVGHTTFGETRQVFTGKPIMQQRHGFIGRGQRCVHVGTFEDQRVVHRIELQRGMERLFVRGQVHRRLTLQHDFARLQGAPGQPAAQRQSTSQRGFGALPGGRQMIAMHRQNQRIAFGQQAKAQVGAFGDDPLVAHQTHKAFGQCVAGHQGVTGDVKRRRAHHLAHVQADRRVARQLDRALPQARHGILRKTGVGVVEGGVIQAQLLEQTAAIKAVHFQCLDYPHRPACRSCSFAHGVFLIKQAENGSQEAKDTKVASNVTGRYH
ncbi:hypothetical protein PFWH6_4627 [Pseudomonas fluorescens WH6]|nr:hypothetical protein PFWH6_4627 [Pseudomonas fluorescens WH6]